MWIYLIHFTFFCIGSLSALPRDDFISFNVDPKPGSYEGFFDERTREVEMKREIEARVRPAAGVSASGKICGFQLWSQKEATDNAPLPFLVLHKKDGRAVLRVKTGAAVVYKERHLWSFFVQAFDCDPIKHTSRKVPVLIHVIPNERPIWTAKAYTFSVQERQPAGTKVGTVDASEHGDSLNKRMCAYNIVRPQDAPFDVDGNGALWTRRTLHYNEVVNYILRVKATDCWVPKPRSSLVSVNIRVLPVCETGWQGIFSQINYRAGSGARQLASEDGVSLVPSCDAAATAVQEVNLQISLSPGPKNACSQTNGCPLTRGERLGDSGTSPVHSMDFTAPTVEAASHWLQANLLFENTDLEPSPSKRIVTLRTSIRFAPKGRNARPVLHQLRDQEITIVLLPRVVSLLHPRLQGEPAADQLQVSERSLQGPGFPVLQRLQLVRDPAGPQEPAIDFCVLRVHPKMTPVAYLEWPKELAQRAGLTALNTSEQLNLKGVAPARVYRDVLRRVRYHHGYPFALNSSSFVLVCLEHNSPDAGNSAMLLLRLRIHHAAAPATAVPAEKSAAVRSEGLLRQPPPAILHAEHISTFEEVPPKARSNQRSHASPLHPVTSSSSGTWSPGAIVGFVLGLFFLGLASYLAVLRWRRFRNGLAAVSAGGANLEGRGSRPGGLPRAESHDRQVGGTGLEMEWDNSEMNITVNPMQESFTKYCQVVHYREFSSDEEQEEDEEELSSLLSGIPEEEEEAGRSSGGSMGGGGREEEEWQWEDEMMPGLAARPANARA